MLSDPSSVSPILCLLILEFRSTGSSVASSLRSFPPGSPIAIAAGAKLLNLRHFAFSQIGGRDLIRWPLSSADSEDVVTSMPSLIGTVRCGHIVPFNPRSTHYNGLSMSKWGGVAACACCASSAIPIHYHLIQSDQSLYCVASSSQLRLFSRRVPADHEPWSTCRR